jgi:hypothetical protein
MNSKVREYLVKAEYCERMASASNDIDARASFREIAHQWRELARQQESLDKDVI